MLSKTTGETDKKSGRLRRLTLILLLGACVYFLTYGFFSLRFSLSRNLGDSDRYASFGYDVPMPHHVPRYQGGLSFRFAMAHDVIHQRFARHGPDYYQRRNDMVRAKLQGLKPDDPARWPLVDDLGAGLDRVGRPTQAVTLLREKLAEQKRQRIEGRELYTSLANLGTFLIHANFGQALRGNTGATESFREGVDLIHESVRVNPQAHFGREQWQAVVGEFFLASFESPELLTRFDCIGNRLNVPIELQDRAPEDWVEPHPLGFGRPHNINFRRKDFAQRFYEPGIDPADAGAWPELKDIRRGITLVGGDFFRSEYDDLSQQDKDVAHYPALAAPKYYLTAPFDEPMLGIIGMWREGGGANPHFALAIAETMLRVGQRRIAWTAYERAERLQDRFSPDPDLRAFLHKHCTRRKAALAMMLGAEEAQRLAATFEQELEFGQEYQAAYHRFERRQIAGGIDPGTEGFDTAFFESREPIASRPGAEETYRILDRKKLAEFHDRRASGYAWLAAGIVGLLPITPNLVRHWWNRRRAHPSPQRVG